MPHPDGLPQHAWYFFAIFTGVVFALVVEPLPAPAIGLIGVTIVAASAPWTLFGPAEISARGFDAPGRAVQWALSGFNNSTVWLAFSAFMFGTAYERTGLGRRIALSLVKTMGRRTLFLGHAVMLSDLLIAPLNCIQLTVDNGWVILNGNVGWHYQRRRAHDTVSDMAGVRGVSNLIKLRPDATSSAIGEHIKAAFGRNAIAEAQRIKVEVAGDAVILEGKIRVPYEREIAERAAWSVPGVRSVDNRLRLV
jgi:di/tricarboxylate transporter